jgi:hypothetical protein
VAQLRELSEYDGVQGFAYHCGFTTFGHKWCDERHYDCARCGEARRAHIRLRSEEFGDFLLCPSNVADASFVVGRLVYPPAGDS